jgi:hypothetical protein
VNDNGFTALDICSIVLVLAALAAMISRGPMQ